MNKKFKTTIILLFLIIFLIITYNLTYRAFPIVRNFESYKSIISKELFYKKLHLSHPPKWITNQIEKDLELFKKNTITLKKIRKTYKEVSKKANKSFEFYRYRIINNKLYKYKSSFKNFSNTDTRFEKAIKTLLCLATLPDCDFLLADEDGIYQSHMPKDFFFYRKHTRPSSNFCLCKNKRK